MTKRERKFCEFYAEYQSKWLAVEDAGYKIDDISEQTAKGTELLARDDIQEYLNDYLLATSLSKELIIARLGKVALSNLGDFLNDDFEIDMQKASELGSLSCVRKYTRKVAPDGSVTETIELVDSLRAISVLLEYLRNNEQSNEQAVISIVHPFAVEARVNAGQVSLN